uniref:Predicted protein n=1 Tax=Hordeum vulgare subsp. vulgare TaxID=112509 RepID=F2DEX5_HORVV|nr:predicted protein [Hordeum vulgare subsp. vulgare]BAJ93877.1 predicted protein [Hordeum vulgare subsp. vulgare]
MPHRRLPSQRHRRLKQPMPMPRREQGPGTRRSDIPSCRTSRCQKGQREQRGCRKVGNSGDELQYSPDSEL